VERLLTEAAQRDHWLLGPALQEVLPGRGKRLRPMLTLLSGRLFDYDPRRLVLMGCATEVLHTATLIHDDVVDESTLRRGAPTLYTRVGNAVAVLVGDYLFAKSAALATATGSLRVMELFAECVMLMVEGQIEEAARRPDAHLSLTRAAYDRTIYAKTAALFGLSCQTGGILAGAPDEAQEVLREFGTKLGLAFQIVDDVLDYAGDEATVGKPLGHDLIQGIITLPVLYLRESLPEHEFRAAFDGNGDWASLAPHVVALVRASDAIDRCYDDARRLVEDGLALLERLPAGEARDALAEIAEYVVARER